MRLYNIDHQPVTITPDLPAIKPGESHDFTAEEIEAGIAGIWSKENPRKGIAAERAFKRRRDKEIQEPAPPDDTDPDESGEQE